MEVAAATAMGRGLLLSRHSRLAERRVHLREKADVGGCVAALEGPARRTPASTSRLKIILQ